MDLGFLPLETVEKREQKPAFKKRLEMFKKQIDQKSPKACP